MNIIENNIEEVKIISNIYAQLNYKNLSTNVIEYINNYFIKNLYEINDGAIFFLFKTINSNRIKEVIIKEDELFFIEKNPIYSSKMSISNNSKKKKKKEDLIYQGKRKNLYSIGYETYTYNVNTFDGNYDTWRSSVIHESKSTSNLSNQCYSSLETQKKENKSIYPYNLLEEIIKKNLLIKYPQLYQTEYMKSTIEIITKIKDNIKAGKINFNLLHSYWNKERKNKEKKDIIKERLTIILLDNKKEVDIFIRELKAKYNKIIEIFEYFQKLKTIIKEIFEAKYQSKISYLMNLEEQIKEGLLNIIEDGEIKTKIDEIFKIFFCFNKYFIFIFCWIFSFFFIKKTYE